MSKSTRNHLFIDSKSGVCKSVVLVILIFLYGAGSLRIDSLHRLLHDHAVELHTQEQENNACHRTVFHGSGSSCEHPTHFSVYWKCPLCDIRFDSHIVEIACPKTALPVFANIADECEAQDPILAALQESSTRGPPHC